MNKDDRRIEIPLLIICLLAMALLLLASAGDGEPGSIIKWNDYYRARDGR